VRVNPGELVPIAATFNGFTGRYMYHCHLPEHEDHNMVRPFVVMPAAAIAAMGEMPGMATMPGIGDMAGMSMEVPGREDEHNSKV
jgi:hypothetical protein